MEAAAVMLYPVETPPRRQGIQRHAVTELMEFLKRHSESQVPSGDFAAFETQLHRLFTRAESDVLAEELEKHDVSAPVVRIKGVDHHHVLRCEETYQGPQGPLRVERSLYSTRKEGEGTVCPLELGAGIVSGRWTPKAAQQIAWVIAHLTPGEAETLFEQFGGMTPSKSSLDRLPKELSRSWEEDRERYEERLRSDTTVPRGAVTVAISLDGVMVPMRCEAEEGISSTEGAPGPVAQPGPLHYQEVGCGTLSFYDREGERLETLRLARMPESKKETLKAILTEELQAVLEKRPTLQVVKLADGARDNWKYLEGQDLPGGPSLVDYWHATQHLKNALDVAYGEGQAQAKGQFEKWRCILRDIPGGVDKVIRALTYLRDKHPKRTALEKELAYFRHNRRRMRYAEAKENHWPIGTGVTEAACKTLATQRLKRSGMRWSKEGGQAVLTFRALAQSNRFEEAWKLLAATYKDNVEIPQNVIDIHSRLQK